MAKRSMFVGMDVHKESIDISLGGGRDGEVRHYGVIPGDLEGGGKVGPGASGAEPTVAIRVRSGPVWVWPPPLSHRPRGGVRRR
jgi:hypothetical protein